MIDDFDFLDGCYVLVPGHTPIGKDGLSMLTPPGWTAGATLVPR